jgi:hypothetical protein
MLNERLFDLLENTFGKGRVGITSENTPMHFRYVPSRDSTQAGRKRSYRLEISQGGEEYLISCPYCSDTRRRCSINHRWGSYDTKTRNRNLWLWHCFNEECQDDYDNRKELYRSVCKDESLTIDNEVRQVSVNCKPKAITWPGDMWMFSDILLKEPSHKAIQYVEDRLYDPQKLAKYFNVGYCGFSHLPNAHDRIIAPVYQDKKLVGWQARLIGESAAKGVPKWWTSPGMKRSRVLYNLDLAKRYQTKVLVEGPGDVWSFGLPAVGIFGKSMTRDQITLLADSSQEGDSVVVLLDPDQDRNEKDKGKMHHIEKVYRDLSDVSKFRGRVLKVYLPSGRDPGDLDRDYMQKAIRHVAAQEKVDINFKINR